MTRTDRTYRRTKAGTKALKSPNAIPPWYRIVLRLVHEETHFKTVCEGLSGYARGQVLAWLDELDTLGLVELVACTPSMPSPDTTGNFSIFSTPARDRERAA